MTFSPLATGEPLVLGFYHTEDGRKLRRWMPRLEPIRGVINHHIVGDIFSLQRELVKPYRTLSVNYGNSQNGIIHPCVAEEFKANTSSHYADHSHVTIEHANVTLAPEYRIGDETFDSGARLNADIARRNGFVPSASTIRFHRQYYATACPGPDFWSRRDEFIDLTREYYFKADDPAPTPAPEELLGEESDMAIDVIKNTGSLHVYSSDTQFLRHETSRAAADRTAKHTRTGKIIELSENDFKEYLNARGIPLDAAEAVLGGKLWSPSTGLVDARNLTI